MFADPEKLGEREKRVEAFPLTCLTFAKTHLLCDVITAWDHTVVGLEGGTVEFVRLFDSVDTHEPVLAGVSLFEISQVKVFVSNHSISCAIITSWSSGRVNKVSVVVTSPSLTRELTCNPILGLQIGSS